MNDLLNYAVVGIISYLSMTIICTELSQCISYSAIYFMLGYLVSRHIYKYTPDAEGNSNPNDMASVVIEVIRPVLRSLGPELHTFTQHMTNGNFIEDQHREAIELLPNEDVD